MSKQYDLPLAVHRLVCALCLDYDRRRDAIVRRSAPASVLAWYAQLNAYIDVVLAEHLETPELRAAMLYDIGRGVGYDKSAVQIRRLGLGYGLYKSRKRVIKREIARAMGYL